MMLQDAGIPWKVYSPSNVGVTGKYASLTEYPTWDPALYNPVANPEVMAATDHVLPYFTAFRNPLSPLYANAFTPTFPNDFAADVKSGSLPSVSWIIPPLGFDEHPSSAPANGMYFTSLVLEELTSNPEVWSKTALFPMYDENDGWFDHVPRPTAPAGTPGEYLTAIPPKLGDPKSDTLNIAGPLGLGVRVPMLVISPFSRGGHIASEVFDHTSCPVSLPRRWSCRPPAPAPLTTRTRNPAAPRPACPPSRLWLSRAAAASRRVTTTRPPPRKTRFPMTSARSSCSITRDL
jgi:phospholipase C